MILRKIVPSIAGTEVELCKHITTRSFGKAHRLDFSKMPMLHGGSDLHTQFDHDLFFSGGNDFSCIKCVRKGTYTQGRFVARSQSDGTGGWLHIELLFRRPLCTESLIPEPRYCTYPLRLVHRQQHASDIRVGQPSLYDWWEWACYVAQSGFDWRRRSPARYLMIHGLEVFRSRSTRKIRPPPTVVGKLSDRIFARSMFVPWHSFETIERDANPLKDGKAATDISEGPKKETKCIDIHCASPQRYGARDGDICYDAKSAQLNFRIPMSLICSLCLIAPENIHCRYSTILAIPRCQKYSS